MLHNQWDNIVRESCGHWTVPKIYNLETKFLSGTSETSGNSAVIKMIGTDHNKRQHMHTASVASTSSKGTPLTTGNFKSSVATTRPIGAISEEPVTPIEMDTISENNIKVQHGKHVHNKDNKLSFSEPGGDVDIILREEPKDGYGNEHDTGHSAYPDNNNNNDNNNDNNDSGFTAGTAGGLSASIDGPQNDNQGSDEANGAVIKPFSLAIATGETHQGGDSISLISEGR